MWAHIQDYMANYQWHIALSKVTKNSHFSHFVLLHHTVCVFCINGCKSQYYRFIFLIERCLLQRYEQIHFWVGRVLYGFISIWLFIQSSLTSSFAAYGHLLMVAASRGSRAAVKALERRVAEPHSMAFSCRTQLFMTPTELYWASIRGYICVCIF